MFEKIVFSENKQSDFADVNPNKAKTACIEAVL